MNRPDSEPGEYGLVMPFVTCQSQGGPHDDASYVAGCEMGWLDTYVGLLATVADLGPAKVTFNRYIHPANQPQADLIAMRHGYTAVFEPWKDDPSWAWMELSRESRGEGGVDDG